MKLSSRIYKYLSSDSLHLKCETPNVESWELFLKSLPVANNAVERAHNKYLCWLFYFSAKKRILFNFAGFICMLIEFPLLLISYRKNSQFINNMLVIEKHNEVGYESVIPEEFFHKFDEVKVIDNIDNKFGFVSKESRQYVLACIRKYPTDFFFHYFICKELIAHDLILGKFMPEAVAVYVNERNVATPILKEIYEQQGRKLLSFMHGEYLLNILQAYMSFSEYYVWDASYVESFNNFLRCDIDHYRVYTPKKLEKKWNLENIQPKYMYTYYFSNDDEETVRIIAKIFSNLQKKSINCKVRPHPRFMKCVIDNSDLFENVFIEQPSEVSLEESLGNTAFAVGLFTTVLFEAEIEGRSIIIDDISNRVLFESLVARRARILTHKFQTLSSVIKFYNISRKEL